MPSGVAVAMGMLSAQQPANQAP